MYNVFVDFHHAGLLQSFINLFEKRLKGNVYRPIGMEWAEKGFWKVYDHPATQAQYLDIGGATPDGTQKLNEIDYKNDRTISDGMDYEWYNCHDIDSGKTNKAIHYWAFMRAPINIVIASLPQHIEPFAKLCELHPNKPKLIYQVGNSWNYDGNQPVKNIMASARMNGITVGINTIEYHQEFDINIFKPNTQAPQKNISSFINCFDTSANFKEDWQLFKEVESSMPEWIFKAYGGQCRDGAIGPSEVLAQTMRNSQFIWHTKAGGDGYGHIIHNVPAVGRPLIVKKQYYNGKMAEPLLIDELTCVVIDGLNSQQIINKIIYYSEPIRYANMCLDAYTNFKQLIDFDKEEEAMRKFLSDLV